MLSFAVRVVDVQPVNEVDEFSTALDNEGFVPPPPTMLVTGNPAPSAARRMSTVTEPLGLPIKSHPVNVPPYGILIGFFVPLLTTDPEPSTGKVNDLPVDPPAPLNPENPLMEEYPEYPLNPQNPEYPEKPEYPLFPLYPEYPDCWAGSPEKPEYPDVPAVPVDPLNPE